MLACEFNQKYATQCSLVCKTNHCPPSHLLPRFLKHQPPPHQLLKPEFLLISLGSVLGGAQTDDFVALRYRNSKVLDVPKTVVSK
jgi:hypothetical protein